MAERRKIGILGGMGPEAAIELQWLIVREAQLLGANSDAAIPPMLVEQNTAIPNRTASILEGGESPLAQMKASLKILEQGGCSFAVIPCVTAHHWLTELQAASSIPVLDLVGLAADEIAKGYSHIRSWLVLATSGTSAANLFPAKTAIGQSLFSLAPDSTDQALVMDAINNPRYGIKAGFKLPDDELLRQDFGVSPTALLHEVIDRYRVMQKVEGIVLACTELPLAVDRFALERSGMAVVDPLEIAARAVAEIAMGARMLPKKKGKQPLLKIIHGANDA